MDNASKNAKDMIGSLQMKYNRGRQASITNELVDIITGASGTSPFSPHIRLRHSDLTSDFVQRSNGPLTRLSMLPRTNLCNGRCRCWTEMDSSLKQSVSRSASDVWDF
jgi:ATP synthase